MFSRAFFLMLIAMFTVACPKNAKKEPLPIRAGDPALDNENGISRGDGPSYQGPDVDHSENPRRYIDVSDRPADIGLGVACEFANVKTVNLLTDPNDPRSDIFTYRYQHINRRSSETIVYIPGGPGQAGIQDVEEITEKYPKDKNIILIDPRGVGCNSHDFWLKNRDLLTTETHAADIASLVAHLKLKNYVFYGISYGTVAATVAAHTAEAYGFKPTAVLLEGVLDASFSDARDVTNEYKRQFELLLKRQPQIGMFLSEDRPLGYEQWQWSRFINWGLIYGSEYLESLMVGYLAGQMDIYEFRKYFELIISNDDDNKDPFKQKNEENFYQAIGCQEIFIFSNEYLTFDRGHAVFQEAKRSELPCYQNPIVRPYDSRDFQLTSRLYYLQGSDDPATPHHKALNHYENQTKTPFKDFISVKGGGHNPFGFKLEDCREGIWQNIFAGRSVKALVGADGECVNKSMSLTSHETKKIKMATKLQFLRIYP